MKLKAELKYILQIIRVYSPISRKDVAKKCQISIPKATNLINALEKAGIIAPLAGESSGGRIPQLLKIQDDLFFSAGIDIGSKYVRIGLFDMGGRMLAHSKQSHNIETPREITIDYLSKEIEVLSKKILVPYPKINTIGVGITGIVQEKEGKCLSLRNTPAWRGLDICNQLQLATKIKSVYVLDSVKAMAFAEMRFGKGREIQDFVVFNIGVGLGAGIIIGSELLSGERGTTGEVGHMHIRPSNELCVCGNYGCLEAIASGWALLRKCKKAIAEGVETSIGESKDLANLSVDDIIESAHHGDKFAITMLENMAKDLAVGIGSVINLLNPEKVILSGGVIRSAGNHLLEPLTRGVKSTVIPWLQKNIDISLSELGEWDAALGAATFAADKAIKEIFFEE
ncbi:MAG TPA: ROK family transcriptional regulator [bacterium]|nr:ROK family transcriptional regulator [bacterium]